VLVAVPWSDRGKVDAGSRRIGDMFDSVQSPDNLQIMTRARALAVSVYRATSNFPQGERFGLCAQMRRAAISVGSNIAEGCGRRGDKELVQFLHIALGSVSELEFQAVVAIDLALISADIVPPLLDEINHTKRMLLKLITAVRRRASHTSAPS
jgi:four helix bundle protein